MTRSKIEQPRAKSEPPNPKLDPNATTNMEKAPEDWVSGDEPMTGAQASYLKTLTEEASHPNAYDDTLTKAEASKRIDALKEELVWDNRANRVSAPTRLIRSGSDDPSCVAV